RVKELDPAMRTKSGIMLGLGETREEVLEVFSDLRQAQCDIVTVGQYLRPSARHLPVERYAPPEEFETLARDGKALGLPYVFAGPFVRSSYNAAEVYAGLKDDSKNR